MFKIRVYLTNTCLACFDLLVIAACYFGTLASGSYAAAGETVAAASTLSLWLILFFYFGMYRSRRLDSPLADLTIIFKVSLTGWMLLQALGTVFPPVLLTGAFVLRFVAVSFTCLAVTRSLLRAGLHQIRRRGYNVKKLVLIATPELGDRLAQKIERRSHYGFRIIKRFEYADSGDDGENLLQSVREFIRSNGIDDALLALPGNVNDLCARLAAECEGQGVNVRIVPDLLPLIQADTQIYDLDGIPLVNARLYPTEFIEYIVIKRIFDLSVSALILVVFSPLFLLVSLLIKMTSPGPVFFTQDRIGMNGKRFRIIKFRTMMQTPSLDPDSHWTVPNDCHITSFGHWLRRTNLDEIPQFLNVLKGEMSIVGPRPERPFFLERFRREVPGYMARHYVKSGITGWAQVNGWRGDTPIPERVAHDLFYIRNWAVSFDIKILFLTLARMLLPGAGSLRRES